MKQWLFICIALAAITPWLLHPGYLMFPDWQGTPIHPALNIDSTNGISGFPVTILWSVLSFILGSAMAQKILIGIALALAASTTAQLAYTLTRKELPSFLAGLFAMSNFFIINRIAMGHIYVLYGYAIAPLAIITLHHFLQQPSRKNGLLAGVTGSLVILTSIHYIVLLPILLCIFIAGSNEAKKISLRMWGIYVLPLCMATIIALAFLFTAPSTAVTQLRASDLLLFAPQTQCFPAVFLDSTALTSTWRNPASSHPACQHNTIPVAATILLLIPLCIGALQKKFLAIGAIILIILASIPLIPAMRDSGKFLGDLATVESILLAYGLSALYQSKHSKIITPLSIIVVVIAALPLCTEISRITIPTDYPQSWYQWNAQLGLESQKPTVLFLPWHLYMPFDFTHGTTIGNPAQSFFTHAHIIQGDNYEMHQGSAIIPSQSNQPISKEVERIISNIHSEDFSDQLQQFLQHEHITYIALAHGSPEQNMYEERFRLIPYLKELSNQGGLTVWKFVQ